MMPSKEVSLKRQVYTQLREKGEDLRDAVAGAADEKAYFDSGDVAERLGFSNTSEVGKMLEVLRNLDVLEAYNPESNSSNTYISKEFREERLSDFLENPREYIADVYRFRGMGRGEAAQKLAEFTDWSPATYNSKFTEWGIRFGGHPDELREEILEEAEDYDRRGEATMELSEEYEEVSPRTIDNWINEERIYFDPTEDEREVVRNQMDFFRELGFPRDYSLETVSYLKEVPESTISDWIAGVVFFEEE